MLRSFSRNRSALVFTLAAGTGSAAFCGWDEAKVKQVHNLSGQAVSLVLAAGPRSGRVGFRCHPGDGGAPGPALELALPEGPGDERPESRPVVITHGAAVEVLLDTPGDAGAVLNLMDGGTEPLVALHLFGSEQPGGDFATAAFRFGAPVEYDGKSITLLRTGQNRRQGPRSGRESTAIPLPCLIEAEPVPDLDSPPAGPGNGIQRSRSEGFPGVETKADMSPGQAKPGLGSIRSRSRTASGAATPADRDRGGASSSLGQSLPEVAPWKHSDPTGERLQASALDASPRLEKGLEAMVINQSDEPAVVYLKHPQARANWVICLTGKSQKLGDSRKILMGPGESIKIHQPVLATDRSPRAVDRVACVVTDANVLCQVQVVWEVVLNHLPASALRIKGGKMDGRDLAAGQLPYRVHANRNYLSIFGWSSSEGTGSAGRADGKSSLSSPASTPTLSPAISPNLSPLHSPLSSPGGSPPRSPGLLLPPLPLTGR